MPFETVDALRKSPLYARLVALREMGEAQLGKFIQIFSAVWDRVKRNGGTDDEAEASGLAIALSTAKHYRPMAAGRRLEAAVHYFAPMAHQQLGDGANGIQGAEYTFNFVKSDPALASVIASGNEFNDDHDPSKGVGVIHELVLASAVPEDVRAKLDKDAPFVFKASYYEDAKPEVKALASISAEWLKAGNDAIPLTFAVTPTPLNPPVTGIKKVASATTDTSVWSYTVNATDGSGATWTYTGTSTVPEPTFPWRPIQDHNGPNPEPRLDGIRQNSFKLKSTEKAAVESTMTEIETLKASLAEAEKVEAALKTEVASLKDAVKAKDAELLQLKASMRAKEAEEFAAVLVKDGKIATDAAPKWAASFVKDAENAKELAASLKPIVIAESPARGENRPSFAADDPLMAAALAVIKAKSEVQS